MPVAYFPAKLKVAVIGAGAIGAYYGALLARQGHEVHFLLRSDFDAVRTHGFQITTPAESFRIHPVRAHLETTTIGSCDLVLIALKTTANHLFPQLLPPLFAKGRTLVLTLQNGMGNVEAISRICGVESVLAGLCFVCVNRTQPGVIENFLPGSIQLAEGTGPLQPRTRELADIFQASGITCGLEDSLEKALWFKLCWNVPFNGIAIAAGSITVDKIIASMPLRALNEALMRELQEAAALHGVSIPESHLRAQFKANENMGAYRPSSLIDYLEGRPVEIESIWGEPLRRGQAKGLPMGHLSFLYHLIFHLVKSRGNASSSSVSASGQELCLPTPGK